VPGLYFAESPGNSCSNGPTHDSCACTAVSWFLANRQARHPLGGRMHGHSAPVSSRFGPQGVFSSGEAAHIFGSVTVQGPCQAQDKQPPPPTTTTTTAVCPNRTTAPLPKKTAGSCEAASVTSPAQCCPPFLVYVRLWPLPRSAAPLFLSMSVCGLSGAVLYPLFLSMLYPLFLSIFSGIGLNLPPLLW
jgi:hypothetical protein